MTPDQISRLLDALERIASKSHAYTITGAADWPILVVIGFYNDGNFRVHVAGFALKHERQQKRF